MAGVMSLLWVIYGYSFATTDNNPFIGGASKLFLEGVTPDSDSGGYPETIFVVFQMTFAIITSAPIIGAFAELIKFSAVMVFSIIWFTISYLPIWHMAWNINEGFFHKFYALDFAGGTVVHINAAVAGLVGCLMVSPRKGFVGVILTGVFCFESMGGSGAYNDTFTMGSQVWGQTVSVLITIAWSGVAAAIAFGIAKVTVGLRTDERSEESGLDQTDHGESAYTDLQG